ncbi:hypothetical protein HMPREF0484_4569 [Klebsiella pneumoniae subsp. rhinoscleromatis ATCC 13884]|nr:hypothetical protein HMPREF0484_4569 [Klebsiella pneumoniae subsp. rhinoscleromatis ATCC 13884]
MPAPAVPPVITITDIVTSLCFGFHNIDCTDRLIISHQWQ